MSTAAEGKGFWWYVGGVATLVGLGAGAVAISRVRKAIQAPGAETKKPKEIIDPGLASFYRVLTHGVDDNELLFSRSGLGSMLYFHKAFGDARLLGISPTELAVSGRFFGEDVEPVRISVQSDGNAHLDEGRRRYTAAKMAGAHAILADVVLYDSDGDVRAERRAAVNLL